jgi:hypothetical protein
MGPVRHGLLMPRTPYKASFWEKEFLYYFFFSLSPTELCTFHIGIAENNRHPDSKIKIWGRILCIIHGRSYMQAKEGHGPSLLIENSIK